MMSETQKLLEISLRKIYFENNVMQQDAIAGDKGQIVKYISGKVLCSV